MYEGGENSAGNHLPLPSEKRSFQDLNKKVIVSLLSSLRMLVSLIAYDASRSRLDRHTVRLVKASLVAVTYTEWLGHFVICMQR